MIKIIKQINERQTLAEREGNYYLISQSREDIVPVEVLVFPCDKDGNVKEWLEKFMQACSMVEWIIFSKMVCTSF